MRSGGSFSLLLSF
ncbi:MAG: hypothetical protein EOP51_03445 [Sphingobacteriales bacterium]|nr:MAG: hypothetical protein EOP51_03445 [Sphingobacteriales bacterium]